MQSVEGSGGSWQKESRLWAQGLDFVACAKKGHWAVAARRMEFNRFFPDFFDDNRSRGDRIFWIWVF